MRTQCERILFSCERNAIKKRKGKERKESKRYVSSNEQTCCLSLFLINFFVFIKENLIKNAFKKTQKKVAKKGGRVSDRNFKFF